MVEPGLGREVAGAVIGAVQQRAVGLAVGGGSVLQLLLRGVTELDGRGLVAIGVLEAGGILRTREQLLERDLAGTLQCDGAILELEQRLGVGEQGGSQGTGLGGTVHGLRRHGPGGQGQADGGNGGDDAAAGSQ